MQRMKRSSILLGCQRKSRAQQKSDDDLDEDEWDIVYELKKPFEIIIADDTSAYQFFGDKLFTAPQEDIIEGETRHMDSCDARLIFFQLFIRLSALRV